MSSQPENKERNGGQEHELTGSKWEITYYCISTAEAKENELKQKMKEMAHQYHLTGLRMGLRSEIMRSGLRWEIMYCIE